MKQYTMKMACQKSGLSYDTLKYYCREGLIPNVKRDQNNRRVFDDQDLAWIESLLCLKNCGLSLAEMKIYIKLCLGGKKTIPERQQMLAQKQKILETKMQQLQASLDYISHKQKLYDDMLSGKVKYYSNLIKN